MISTVLVNDPDITASRADVGAKAANLAHLRMMGLPVPRLAAIPVQTAHSFVQANTIAMRLAELPHLTGTNIYRLRETIRTTDLAPPVIQTIAASAGELAKKGGGIAVRSSALQEDSTLESFAGQFDSFLAVRGIDQILRRVKDCWASYFNARVAAYTADRTPSPGLGQVQMGVLLQQQVYPWKSGVMFTRHPVDGSRVTYIESTFGTAEAVVEGLANSDSTVVDPDTDKILSVTISAKTQVTMVSRNKSLSRTLPMPPSFVHRPVLSTSDAIRLQHLGRRIEEVYGVPQDIEWAIDEDDDLWLLQARPITTSPHDKEIA